MNTFNAQAGFQPDADSIARRLNALESGTGISLVGPLLFPNGSTAAPSIAFASATGNGIYNARAGYMALAVGGTQRMGWDSSGRVDVAAISFGFSGDAILTRDAANTLAQRNGTAAQTFNLYGTYTDASNYARASVSFSGTDAAFSFQNAGTGASGGVVIQQNGNTLARFTNFGTPVNFSQIVAASTGNYPGFSSVGADTNIGFNIGLKGTGTFNIGNGTANSFTVTTPASLANGAYIASSAAGSAVIYSAAGSDTNIAVQIANKGTAVMQLAGQTIGTAVGAAGAAAAMPTPAQYLTLNVNGTNYRVALFN